AASTTNAFEPVVETSMPRKSGLEAIDVPLQTQHAQQYVVMKCPLPPAPSPCAGRERRKHFRRRGAFRQTCLPGITRTLPLATTLSPLPVARGGGRGERTATVRPSAAQRSADPAARRPALSCQALRGR